MKNIKRNKEKDYTDILTEIKNNPEFLPPTDYLFVDEAQDLTPLMWNIIDEWCKKAKTVVIAGDDDQSIYAFKGAEASYFLAQRENAKIFHLPISYRVPENIKNFAVSIIQNVKNREKKNFISVNKGGEIRRMASLSQFVKQEGKKYILARTRYILENLVPYLENEGIPFLPINPKHSGISPWTKQLIQLTNAISKFPDITDPFDIAIIIKNSPASIFKGELKHQLKKILRN